MKLTDWMAPDPPSWAWPPRPHHQLETRAAVIAADHRRREIIAAVVDAGELEAASA